MKATSKYNKSEIMTTAWKYFKAGYGGYTFAECLKCAWINAKKQIRIAEEIAKEKKVVELKVSIPTLAFYEHFYRNSRYIGD